MWKYKMLNTKMITLRKKTLELFKDMLTIKQKIRNLKKTKYLN